ncbi:rod shape-determining protein [Asanoa sp. NPDC050611]|uniref:rod shape-determining protein n=1 Tax=Asanoa sp. NPDC050611 TaxID=3157098 RepID=UPI0033DC4906
MSVVDGVDERVRRAGRPAAGSAPVASPTAVGLDLGSGYARMWASGRALAQTASINDSLTNPVRPVRRGRISDPAGLSEVLTRLLGQQHPAVPAGAVVVACRPVLATAEELSVTRKLLDAALAPSRVLFIDTVRAAAIGAGAGPGTLLVADVGAAVTEVAVLADGSVKAARRAAIGMSDLLGPVGTEPIVHTIAEFVRDLRRDPRCRGVSASAIANGLLMVGGGAGHLALAPRTAATLGLAVRVAGKPRIAAVHGAGLAALAALRRNPSAAA